MNLDQQIAIEIEQLAQKGARSIGKKMARQMLAEMREAAETKEKARKAEKRRRFELGGAVIDAGLGDWDRAEVKGLLMDGKDRADHSPTIRLAMRKRGQMHLSPMTETPTKH